MVRKWQTFSTARWSNQTRNKTNSPTQIHSGNNTETTTSSLLTIDTTIHCRWSPRRRRCDSQHTQDKL